MSLELDHVFCFCPPDVPEADRAKAMGFSIFPGRQHPGQGTANKCIIFDENYLEFIFLTSKEESEKNELQLHRRAEWEKTNASPFGLALRGVIPDQYKNEFWEYKPAYAQGRSIFIHKFNKDHPEAPLLFVMPGADMASMKPASWSHMDQSLRSHLSGTKKIVSVEVTSPVELPQVFQIPPISSVRSDVPHLTIHLDGAAKKVQLNPILSI